MGDAPTLLSSEDETFVIAVQAVTNQAAKIREDQHSELAHKIIGQLAQAFGG